MEQDIPMLIRNAEKAAEMALKALSNMLPSADEVMKEASQWAQFIKWRDENPEHFELFMKLAMEN